MTDPRFVAVFDIGKTNAKLALHDLASGQDVFVESQPNTVVASDPYPHYDVEGLWRFLTAALKRAGKAAPIDAISVTTHGASIALVGGDPDGPNGGLVLPILDYESDAPEASRAAYDAVRPAFSETFSPRLPNGLNVGAQLFWLEATYPRAFAKARHALTYPQYWTRRLTGVAASEVTSLGCHTDLWMPGKRRFSSLIVDRGWQRLFPQMRAAFETLGPLRRTLAPDLGLGERPIPVLCGIHDSNASLLPHLLTRSAPLTVLSTGTWIIAMAVGGSLDRLDEARDALANVDVFGTPLPSSRFMGGREFDLLTGGQTVVASDGEIAALEAKGVTIRPTFAPGTGPFSSSKGEWSVDPGSLTAGERTAAASIYCAELSATMLELTDAGGPTIVEGPFARNRLFLARLAATTRRTVEASVNATGTTAGAAMLARPHLHEIQSPKAGIEDLQL